jgi:hypothetical protein
VWPGVVHSIHRHDGDGGWSRQAVGAARLNGLVLQ